MDAWLDGLYKPMQLASPVYTVVIAMMMRVVSLASAGERIDTGSVRVEESIEATTLDSPSAGWTSAPFDSERAIAPDGKNVAYVVRRGDIEADCNRSELRIMTMPDVLKANGSPVPWRSIASFCSSTI